MDPKKLRAEAEALAEYHVLRLYPFWVSKEEREAARQRYADQLYAQMTQERPTCPPSPK